VGKRPREGAIEYRAGVHVRGTVLWCDARHAREVCFLSGVRLGAAAARRHRQVVTTAATARLLGRADTDVLPAPFGRPFHLGRLRLELFPSGAAPGAASLLCEEGGRRVVYAGALAARKLRTAEAMDVRRADIVVLHAEHEPGHTAGALEPLIDWIAAEETPVVLGALGGELEELAAELGARGLALRGHPALVAAVRAYRKLGADLRPIAARGGKGAILWPISVALPDGLATVGRRARVGSAAVPHDVSFAWSVLADSAALRAYLAATGAREVYLVGPAAESTALDLRASGLDARALGPPRQLSLFA